MVASPSSRTTSGGVNYPQLPPSPPCASSRNNDNNLAQDLDRLSLNTSSIIAPPSGSPRTNRTVQRSLTVPNATIPKQTPSPHTPEGRRTPSSSRSTSRMSINDPSSSPQPRSLTKRTSMSSLLGANAAMSGRQSPSGMRRSSSLARQNGSAMPRSPLSAVEDGPPASPPVTAESIAKNHFQEELENFHSAQQAPGDIKTETIAIVHDLCYGHRFSEPQTLKKDLDNIVERPERVLATIVGMSAAYVRLGGRHTSAMYSPNPKRKVSDIRSVPFRIRKSTRKVPLSSVAVTNVHGVTWMMALKVMCETAEKRLAMGEPQLSQSATSQSLNGESVSTTPQIDMKDLYLCPESLNAMEGALGAVCDGVDAVFNGSASGNGPRRAFVTIRPPGHHCSHDTPSGFCWVNNVHVGISHAALAHRLTHAAIIDFDLHHGDGSQDLALAQNYRNINPPKGTPAAKKTSIGYFSLHDISSFPCEQGHVDKVRNASMCVENAHKQNIWNVHLQPWQTEEEFWILYETRYLVLLEKTRNFLRRETLRISTKTRMKPKACIFLSSGFDASEYEAPSMQRYSVNVPTGFYARFTEDIVKLSMEEGCGVEGRIVSVLEGGYSNRALISGAMSHMSGLAGMTSPIIKHEDVGYGLGGGITPIEEVASTASLPTSTLPYDPSWWSVQNLEALEAVVYPPVAPIAPRKRREAIPMNYTSPTVAYTAKVVASPHLRRTSSSLSPGPDTFKRSLSFTRPVSPPLPDVEWTTAAHELSKLIIPTDRQTRSHTLEELSSIVSHAKGGKQPIELLPPFDENMAQIPSVNESTQKPVKSTPPRAKSTTAPTAHHMDLRRDREPSRKTASPQSLSPASPAKTRKASSTSPPKRGKSGTTSPKSVTAAGRVISKVARHKPVLTAETAQKSASRSTTPPPPISEPSYAKSTGSFERRTSVISNTAAIASAAQLALTHSAMSSHVQIRSSTSMSSRPDVSTSSPSPNTPPKPSPPIVRKPRTVPATKPVRAPRAAKPAIATKVADENPNKSSDVGKLTDGMKRISIKLVTQAQRDARAQAAEQACDKAVIDEVKVIPAVPGKKTSRISPRKVSAAGVQGKGKSALTTAQVLPEKDVLQMRERLDEQEPERSTVGETAASDTALLDFDISTTPQVSTLIAPQQAQPLTEREIPETPMFQATSPLTPATPDFSLKEIPTTTSQTLFSINVPTSASTTPHDNDSIQPIQSPQLLPPSAPTPPPTTASSTTSTTGASHIFIPYQPEKPTAQAQSPPSNDLTHDTIKHHQELTWLKPNTSSTPISQKNSLLSPEVIENTIGTEKEVEPQAPTTRRELPVFSATGKIPFGVRKE